MQWLQNKKNGKRIEMLGINLTMSLLYDLNVDESFKKLLLELLMV